MDSSALSDLIGTRALRFHIIVAIVLAVPDVLLRHLFKKSPSTCWFYLHAFGNAIVCFFAWRPMLELLSDPIAELSDPHFTPETTWIISVLHVYHLLFFKCKADDWFHHVVFVGLGVSTQYAVNYGKIAALYHFFICGVPGGIDYFILALTKEGWVTKEVRLRIALELNMWVRSPGITTAWALAIVWFMRSPMDLIHIACMIAISIASVINAQFYARQVALAAGKQLKVA